MKYEIVEVCDGSCLVKRIRSLKNFRDIRIGDFGGMVQGYHNLDQEGESWIYENSKVLDDAQILEDAQVCGCSIVCDNSIIFGKSLIQNSEVFGKSLIKDAQIFGSEIGNSTISGDIRINDDTLIHAEISSP